MPEWIGEIGEVDEGEILADLVLGDIDADGWEGGGGHKRLLFEQASERRETPRKKTGGMSGRIQIFCGDAARYSCDEMV